MQATNTHDKREDETGFEILTGLDASAADEFRGEIDGEWPDVSEVYVNKQKEGSYVSFETRDMPDILAEQVKDHVDKRRSGTVATVWWRAESARAYIRSLPADW